MVSREDWLVQFLDFLLIDLIKVSLVNVDLNSILEIFWFWSADQVFDFSCIDEIIEYIDFYSV